MRTVSLKAWVRSTSLGWALGLILVIVLVLGSEMIGLGSAQTPVGLGVGAGVGLLQSRALGSLLPNARLWMFASVAGHLVPFLAYDLAQAAGFRVPFSLYICVALSGVVTGVLQARLLQPWLTQVWWWLPAAIVGWTVAAGSAALADQGPRALSLRGLPGAAVYLALALSGGPILGLITGLVLVRLPRRSGEVVHAASGDA